MKKVISIILLMTAFYLPSHGQIREIFDNGEIVEYYGGLVFETLGESIYSYRFVYGRYPEDKQALLDFQRDQSKVEAKEDELFHGQHLLNLYIGGEYYDDSRYTSLIAKRDSLIAVDLNDPGNVLTVIGDTCTFTYAKATRESYYFGLDDPIPGVKLRAIQCIGGPADLQKKDYRSFRQHIRTLAYDKNGKWLWPLCSDAPYSPDEVRWKYNFVVSRDPGDYPDGRGAYGLARPVLIPFTITRSGALSYDVSCLDGMQLYYRTEVNSTADSIDTIAIEDAIDPDYLDALKTYTKVIFDEHEEVDSVKLWELVYFNNLPKRYISFRDGITGLGVYGLDRLDTLPLCNGVSFSEGFLREFARRFHPEPSDDNPYQFSVKFVIDKNGNLVGSRVKIPSSQFYKSSNKQLSAYEKHVLETVNQIQNWEPGKVDGTPVNVVLTVPVIF